jgi:hypothetical protein
VENGDIQDIQAEPKTAVDRASISVSLDIMFLRAARQLNFVVIPPKPLFFGGNADDISHSSATDSLVFACLLDPRRQAGRINKSFDRC